MPLFWRSGRSTDEERALAGKWAARAQLRARGLG
eukprot:SAG31_NODE_36607_length_311_cov_16.674528_1_plen_33_part_10